MQKIRAQLLLYIPLNTSAVVCVSATKTTVPSSHGKLLFRAATDRVDQQAALSTLLFSCFLSQMAQLFYCQIQYIFCSLRCFFPLINFPIWILYFGIHRLVGRPDRCMSLSYTGLAFCSTTTPYST